MTITINNFLTLLVRGEEILPNQMESSNTPQEMIIEYVIPNNDCDQTFERILTPDQERKEDLIFQSLPFETSHHSPENIHITNTYLYE